MHPGSLLSRPSADPDSDSDSATAASRHNSSPRGLLARGQLSVNSVARTKSNSTAWTIAAQVMHLSFGLHDELLQLLFKQGQNL